MSSVVNHIKSFVESDKYKTENIGCFSVSCLLLLLSFPSNTQSLEFRQDVASIHVPVSLTPGPNSVSIKNRHCDWGIGAMTHC